jgi:hypothetical protein
MDALENLVLRYLGHRYQGRRYLRYAELRELGIVANRATLRLWMEAGAFPRGIKIAGPYGHTLLWLVSEVVQVLADRAADRTASAETEEGASLSQGARPLLDSNYSNRPLPTGDHHEETVECLLPLDT